MATIKDYLDNVLSDDGLKTDIKITMTDQTLRKTSMYAVGTALVITLIVFGVRGVVKNMEKMDNLTGNA
ncbi:MAG TPA: hypothetical protein VIN73_11850 [Vicingaceae bacterium]